MYVRRFRSSDASALASIFHASVREGGLRHYSPEQVIAWSPSLPSSNAYQDRARRSMVFVAVDETDCPIGYADVRSDGYIDHLYCRPDRIGTGVGSALCAAMESAAGRVGIAMLTVDASEGARLLFERRGFRVEARRDFTINGVAIYNYRMARPARLNAPDNSCPLILTGADAGDIADLYARCADYFMLQDGELATLADAVELFGDVPEERSAADQTILGRRDGSGLIAVAAILRDHPSDGVWYLGFMIVDPAARGQGIGRSLYASIEQWTVERGAREMRLACSGGKWSGGEVLAFDGI